MVWWCADWIGYGQAGWSKEVDKGGDGQDEERGKKRAKRKEEKKEHMKDGKPTQASSMHGGSDLSRSPGTSLEQRGIPALALTKTGP
jgi:hypothetical protein